MKKTVIAFIVILILLLSSFQVKNKEYQTINSDSLLMQLNELSIEAENLKITIYDVNKRLSDL